MGEKKGEKEKKRKVRKGQDRTGVERGKRGEGGIF